MRKSNVEMEGILERAVLLHENENMTIKEIAELFKSEGFAVSASGVQRALRAKKLSEKEFQKNLKILKSLSKRQKTHRACKWQKPEPIWQWLCF